MTSRPPIALPSALAPLTGEARWVGWRWVTGKNGKRTKPPFQGLAPHKHARSNDPATWCEFDAAMAAYCNGQCDGIGYMLKGSGVGAFDIDHCRDAASSTLHPWAENLVRRCNSYSEVTPSGSGIRIIGTARGAAVHKKLAVANANGMQVEVYRDAERYITISGQQIGSAPLADIDAQADAVIAELDKKQ